MPSKPQGRKSGIRVLVIDEFSIFAEALGTAIALEDDLVFVGFTTDPQTAVDTVLRERPDVVVVDVDVPHASSPDYDGIAVTQDIKAAFPEVRVLVLAGRVDVDSMARAASEGACGFLPKTSSIQQICMAIRTAKDGGMFVERELVAPLVARLQRGRSIGGGSAQVVITPREQEVLSLLGEGLDVTEIARRLGITLSTSRGHVKSLLSKLGSHSQLEAVVEAIHQGLLPHLSR